MASLAIDLRNFLKDNIRSVGELEVLLFLKRHSREEWDADAIAKAFRITKPDASHILMRLYLQGLINQERGAHPLHQYRYLPLTRATEKKISAIAMAFEQARTDVVDQIFTGQKAQLGAFSDAFLLRKPAATLNDEE